MALAEAKVHLLAEPSENSAQLGVRVAPNTWMRKRGTGTLLYFAYGVVFALFFATGGVVVLFSLGSGEPLALMILVDLMFWVAAALAMRFAVRMARAGVRISPSGVCLRGVLRTRTLPLAGVEGFAPAAYPGGLLRSEVGVRLMRRQGYDLRVWAMRKGAPSSKERLKEAKDGLQPLCKELNQLLQSMRGGVVDSAKLSRDAPFLPADAEKAYRAVRNYLTLSALWFLGVAALTAILGFHGWQIYLGIVVAVEGIGMPLFLFVYRRELDKKVRVAEEVSDESAPVRP